MLYLTILIMLCILGITFGPMIWLESIEPAFIPGRTYRWVVGELIPLMTLGFTLLGLFAAIKKYRTSGEYREHVRSQVKSNGKFKVGAGLLFMPLLIFTTLWLYITQPIILFSYYFADDDWSTPAKVIDAKKCLSEYGPMCTRLELLVPYSPHVYVIYWYQDPEEMRLLNQHHVVLTGYRGKFGAFIEAIHSG